MSLAKETRPLELGAATWSLEFGVLLQWQQRAGEDEDQAHEVDLRPLTRVLVDHTRWRRRATSRPGLPNDVVSRRPRKQIRDALSFDTPRAPVDLARWRATLYHNLILTRVRVHEVIEIRHSIRSRPTYSMCSSGHTLRQSSSSSGGIETVHLILSLVCTLTWSCASLLGIHSLDTRRTTYLVLVVLTQMICKAMIFLLDISLETSCISAYAPM